MIAIQPVERLEDLDNTPDEFTQEDDGRILQYKWADDRFVLVDMPEERRVGQTGGIFIGDNPFSIVDADDFTDTTGAGTDGYAIVWDQGTSAFILSEVTSTIAGADDFTDTTGAGTDGYSVTWDNGTSKFVLTDRQDSAIDHGSIAGLADDDHTQYILATGARTGASSSRQQFTSGITIPSARPVSDGTTAIQFQNTAGTTNVLTIDTTNSYLVLDNFGTIQTHSDVTNTIIGISAKSMSITGQYNSGFGWNCLDQLTSGTRNTAMGGQSLRLLESGARNNGTGWNSLQGLTTGSFNNAMGSDVLYTLSTGSDNCVVGYLGFYNTTTADGNTGIGTGVGQNNVTGSFNCYVGYRAGRNSTGSNNVFLGKFAGENDTSSNRLNIANIATKSLLLGDFSNNTLMIGDTALTVPTAAADIAASTTARSSLRIRSGTAPTTPNDGDMWKLTDTFVLHGSDATTSSIVNTLRLRRNSSGTPATNFGAGFNVQLKSSTTAGQDAGRITWKWTTATHASRASQADFTTFYTSTERTSISIGSNSSAPLLSFFAGTLVAQQSGTGEATGFTAGAGTGVNDDSTFTGNVGSTAYRINDIVKALKNYNLLAA